MNKLYLVDVEAKEGDVWLYYGIQIESVDVWGAIGKLYLGETDEKHEIVRVTIRKVSLRRDNV